MPVQSKTRRKPKLTDNKRPRPQGWLTSDADEIERRRLRGREEAIRLEPLEPEHDLFGTFRAHAVSGEVYRVEIRSLTERINSCDCPDHRINGLGTCKHVEAVLHRLEQRGKRRFRSAAAEGSARVEIYLDRRDGTVRIQWPQGMGPRARQRTLLDPFVSPEGAMLADPLDALPALDRALARLPAAAKASVRISGHLDGWLKELRQRVEQSLARQRFEAEVAAGRRGPEVVKLPLYPYQQEGMLHLAFTGRALLADEMGLGKTIQAIAACELLRHLQGIQRVLVVAPASLKGEWEEQIAKFTDLSSWIVQGPRAARLRQYRQPAFFHLMNYEQVRPDYREINEILKPDVIILDEAQRIKNWQARTAEAVKRLRSQYAFVLTGTPLENRIDEVYSIAQFLDPAIFGPLFRFNRDFYQLDDRGRPTGYKNLDELHRRLRPVMLRRRKEEVEGQLPGRTVNTYFVSMEPEQAVRYDEYQARVARLSALAKRRPLTKEEMEKLQRWLACMRMLCDTPYILDPECRISPKLEELRSILGDLLEEGDHKIIIFSEWERMLELVRESCEEMGIGYAWHTGQVPQVKRRAEIRRFKTDPHCRLFLSTDSGSVGLNLQVADVVMNLDLPWNPAKLEQRIARAWRKHQARSVQVINLVCEHSIEHRMMHLLEQKRSLALGVIDGSGEITQMALPSGRAALLEQLDDLMRPVPAPPAPTRKAPSADPLARVHEDILARWGERLELVQVLGEGAGRTLLVVVDRHDDALRQSIERTVQEHLPEQTPRLELVDHATLETIQRLIDAGMLSAGPQATQILHGRPNESGDETGAWERRLRDARERFAPVGRKRQMAALLADGGFVTEALPPLSEAVEAALHSLAVLGGESCDVPVPIGMIESRLVGDGLLPEDTARFVIRLREGRDGESEPEMRHLLEQGDALLAQAAAIVDRGQPGSVTRSVKHPS